MTPLQIMLILIILPLTILNIRSLTTGRKAKAEARVKYARMLAVLADNEERLGGEGNYTAAKYVSDSGNNYLVCRSKTKDVGAVVSEGAYYPLVPLSESKCTVEEKKNGEKWEKITCTVSSPSLEEPIVVELGANAHGRRMAAFILETAIDFRDEINKN